MYYFTHAILLFFWLPFGSNEVEETSNSLNLPQNLLSQMKTINNIEDKIDKPGQISSNGQNVDFYSKDMNNDDERSGIIESKQNVSAKLQNIGQVENSFNQKNMNVNGNAKNEEEDKKIILTPELKKEMIANISARIRAFAEEYRNIKEPNDKDEKLSSRRRIVDSAKLKKILRTSDQKIDKLTNIIERGIRIYVNKKSKGEEFKTKLPKTATTKNKPDVTLRSLLSSPMRKTTVDMTDKELLIPPPSDPCPCDCQVEKMCEKVKNLGRFQCSDGSYTLEVDKLCDSIFDCRDESDETGCREIAQQKARNASIVLKDIEINVIRNCASRRFEDSSQRNQTVMLGKVLNTQSIFLQKYKAYHPDNLNTGKQTIKNMYNEMAMVVQTVALSLEAALCTGAIESRGLDTRRGEIDLLDEESDNLLSDKYWSVDWCLCKKDLCINPNCDPNCQRVCTNRYSLETLSCKAVDGKSAVPFDFICDGKIDCYDQLDEIGCTRGNSFDKFEANTKFDEILELIQIKWKLEENMVIRTLLHSLHTTILEIQKLSGQSNVKDHTMKSARDVCVIELKTMYSERLKTAQNPSEAEDTFVFVMTVHNKLIEALKLTRTGNEKETLVEGCICQNGTCAFAACTKECNNSCAAESSLTKYLCKSSSNSESITLRAMCDGKPDCSNRRDEKNCKYHEICRKYHLISFRQIVQKVGENDRGTALGEVLLTWRERAIANLNFTEKTIRPSPVIIRKFIFDVLRDLMTTYGRAASTRRSNVDSQAKLLKRFTEVAQNIIETLKDCGK